MGAEPNLHKSSVLQACRRGQSLPEALVRARIVSIIICQTHNISVSRLMLIQQVATVMTVRAGIADENGSFNHVCKAAPICTNCTAILIHGSLGQRDRVCYQTARDQFSRFCIAYLCTQPPNPIMFYRATLC